MSAENMDTEIHRPGDIDYSLTAIKNCSIMLDIGSEYLCETPLLQKVGTCLKENVSYLIDHINDIKKQFVGKPAQKTKLEDRLEQLADFSRLLQKTEKDIIQKCISGELGDKFMPVVKEINFLRGRVEGNPISYTKIDSALGIIGRFKFVATSIKSVFFFLFKIFFVCALICLIVFSLLYFNMGSEKEITSRINQKKDLLSSEKARFSILNKKIEQIQKKIDTINQDELKRQDVIELIDLNIKVYRLEEEKQNRLSKLKNIKDSLNKCQDELEEMQRKSIWQRLLKQ
ncbi:MAG: hypothetical protein J7L16_07325 [Deltaproteobacteria bacterium]|nr:hypothetical protein [Deltaproteobacteria bacterium]